MRAREDWLALLGNAGAVRPFGYIVTPNVDHVVCYHEGVVPQAAYDEADYRICDSRILSKLASLRGIDLPALPGSDMVRDFMASPGSKSVRIGVFGPSAEDFAALKVVYPGHDLLFLDAPMMKPGTPEWTRAIEQLRDAPFDVLLCCISFPKQEMICHALKQAGRESGLAICAGASLDFLIGKQVRAPEWMSKLHLEWLHRLMSDPKRLAYRYLVRGPRIFPLFLRSK